MTPAQRAVRHLLYPGKRGKLSADEYARFAELCIRKGCPLTGSTVEEADAAEDDEQKQQQQQLQLGQGQQSPMQRGTKRSRSKTTGTGGLAGAAGDEEDGAGTLLGLLGAASHANSEQEQPHDLPPQHTHSVSQGGLCGGRQQQQQGQLQPADSLDGSEGIGGHQPVSRKRGRPSKIDSAAEGLIKLNASHAPMPAAMAAAGRHGGANAAAAARGARRLRGGTSNRFGGVGGGAVGHGLGSGLGTGGAAAAGGVVPDDYYEVYVKYLTCMELYSKVVSRGGLLRSTGPKVKWHTSVCFDKIGFACSFLAASVYCRCS
jgi:hypothetical protein